jgi:2',3'-cyclic-nucleotide 2'-phosphodiesterase/3'-nucleotidase
MTRRFSLLLSLVLLATVAFSQSKNLEITILQTSDVHGAMFPFDFIANKNQDASLSQVATYVNEVRSSKKPFILLDNGDILQGQPEAYYYNYVETKAPHLISRVLNFMQYDAATMGNHDIEAGHAVYDKIVKQSKFPWLAANAVKTGTHTPYFKPYIIINRGGLKVAVLGLITPGIPGWLPKDLWTGLEFDDMVESATRWMKIIKTKEKPDIIIGLFHSGVDPTYGGVDSMSVKNENAGVIVAMKVAGFDAILLGHDHSPICKKVAGPTGDSVVIANPGAGARFVSEVTVTVSKGKNGKTIKSAKGKLVPMSKVLPDQAFMDKFSDDYENVKAFTGKPINTFQRTISTKDAYFGPSAFIDLIHDAQIKSTGADISFAAPLSFVTTVDSGKIYVRDFFKLYKYENRLYTVSLTGDEVRKYLEFSYGQWLNTMKSANDYLLVYETDNDGKPLLDKRGKVKVKNRYYNFDSAYGIYYTVDVSKPVGERITITKMANGDAFDLNKRYKVAMNSYRASGGGGHLTEGAGIPEKDVAARTLSMSKGDFRMVLLDIFSKSGPINPQPANYWSIVPTELAAPAKEREMKLLFGGNGEGH